MAVNFTPPDRWLQRPAAPTPSSAAPNAIAPAGQRARGQVAPATGRVAAVGTDAGADPFAAATLQLPADLRPGQALPSSGATLRRRHVGRQSLPVTVQLADFTQAAVALGHLRFDVHHRRGWLLADEQAAQDLLDARDPTAAHLVAYCGGELVGALRLLLAEVARPPEWSEHVALQSAPALAAAQPACELSRLVVAADVDAFAVQRALVQSAAYVALRAGARYALTAAPPAYRALWPRFGLLPTGLGGYVSAARPYVVEVYAADLHAALAGECLLRAWHNLFGGTHAALGGVRAAVAARWQQPLYRGFASAVRKIWLPLASKL